MRKHESKTASVAGLIVLLGFASFKAFAVPVYYTFEGTVNWGPVDDLNMLAGSAAPVASGSTISMVWEIDTDRHAETINLSTGHVSVDTSQAFARLVSGAMLFPAEAGIPTFDGSHTTRFNNAGGAINNANLEDVITGLDGSSHYFQIRKDGGAVAADYVLGATGFSLYERVIKDSLATRYQVLDGLKITGVSSVSGPGAFGVFLLGLIALGRACRRPTRQPAPAATGRVRRVQEHQLPDWY